MAGIHNTGIRDYCGEESSITKLSNHFSKDFAFQQDGINDFSSQYVSNPIPTSFNLNELLNDAINQKNNAIHEGAETSSTVSAVHTKEILPVDNFNQLYQSTENYFEPPRFSISHNIPMNRYIPPDPSLVAKNWAEDELSKFDNTIIDEVDLKKLSEEKVESNIRFLDVVRNVTMAEDRTDIDLFTENLAQANTNFLYDLEEDLKNMREKIDTNANTSDVWKQIDKSLQENSMDFIFSKSNPYLNVLQDNEKLSGENLAVDEILQKGIKLYKEGYFAEATMAFEAVVQMKPQSESGWSYLGMSLSENEQDHKAMIACNKCLELNKNNREVLLSLARIHCNEMNLSSTIACLEQWLLAHPKYSDLATVGQEAIHATVDNQSMLDEMYEMAFESSGKFAILDEQLNIALNRNLLDIDPELELAAGTLYHAVQDYDRATARFEAAVSVVKYDACLWNKLGTSYCNSGNYEKAVDAYKKALELASGFARAECNLGVAYYNMESYKDAIRHAIRAYKIQHGENPEYIRNSEDHLTESDPIWTLIRMSSFKLDRTDLDLVIFNRDIDVLSKEFDV